MSVEPENEVTRALMVRFRTCAPLVALVATSPRIVGPAIFYDAKAGGGHGFPIVIVNTASRALRGTDHEGWKGGRDSITVDVFGTDSAVLERIAAVIDDEITIVETVDTGNFVLTILRRTGPWRRLAWRDHSQPVGMAVTQFTSDWLLVSGRKQGS